MKKKAPKETWTLPAFADRRRKPRPAHESAAARKRGAAQRRKA